MSDSFVPEADRLDQEREVVSRPADDDSEQPSRPLHVPPETPEADYWEQVQEVEEEYDY